MTIIYYDSELREEITRFSGSLSDAPSEGDLVILIPSETYKKAYQHNIKTTTIDYRLIDYRDNSVVLYCK